MDMDMDMDPPRDRDPSVAALLREALAIVQSVREDLRQPSADAQRMYRKGSPRELEKLNNTGCGGMSGRSAWRVIDQALAAMALAHPHPLGRESRFLDIGSGTARVLFAALTMMGGAVEKGAGVELCPITASSTGKVAAELLPGRCYVLSGNFCNPELRADDNVALATHAFAFQKAQSPDLEVAILHYILEAPRLQCVALSWPARPGTPGSGTEVLARYLPPPTTRAALPHPESGNPGMALWRVDEALRSHLAAGLGLDQAPAAPKP